MDFLTPPSAGTLEITRQRGLTMLPRLAVQLPAVAHAPRPIDSHPPRSIQTRQVSPAEVDDRNPALDTFCSNATKGSRHLIELSTLLQGLGDYPYALLAWERVIDSTRPQASSHLSAALIMTGRLRRVVPKWSANNQPVPVVLHLSCTQSVEELVRPMVESLAKDLVQVTHGVLAPTTELVVLPPPAPTKGKSGRTIYRTPTPAVSVWLSGAGPDTRSTPMVSFNPTRLRNLQAEFQRTLLRIAVKAIPTEKGRVALTTPPKSESPLESLSLRITRLRWLELGRTLNLPKPPPPPPAPPKPASSSRRSSRKS